MRLFVCLWKKNYTCGRRAILKNCEIILHGNVFANLSILCIAPEFQSINNFWIPLKICISIQEFFKLLAEKYYGSLCSFDVKRFHWRICTVKSVLALHYQFKLRESSEILSFISQELRYKTVQLYLCFDSAHCCYISLGNNSSTWVKKNTNINSTITDTNNFPVHVKLISVRKYFIVFFK